MYYGPMASFEKKAKYCKLPSGEIESRYVHSAEEEAELGPDWVDNPGYLDGRLEPPKTDKPDPWAGKPKAKAK